MEPAHLIADVCPSNREALIASTSYTSSASCAPPSLSESDEGVSLFAGISRRRTSCGSGERGMAAVRDSAVRRAVKSSSAPQRAARGVRPRER